MKKVATLLTTLLTAFTFAQGSWELMQAVDDMPKAHYVDCGLDLAVENGDQPEANFYTNLTCNEVSMTFEEAVSTVAGIIEGYDAEPFDQTGFHEAEGGMVNIITFPDFQIKYRVLEQSTLSQLLVTYSKLR